MPGMRHAQHHFDTCPSAGGQGHYREQLAALGGQVQVLAPPDKTTAQLAALPPRSSDSAAGHDRLPEILSGHNFRSVC